MCYFKKYLQKILQINQLLLKLVFIEYTKIQIHNFPSYSRQWESSVATLRFPLSVLIFKQLFVEWNSTPRYVNQDKGKMNQISPTTASYKIYKCLHIRVDNTTVPVVALRHEV